MASRSKKDEVREDGHVTQEFKDDGDREYPEGFVWTNENAAASGRSFKVADNDTSGYVGVDQEYRTYGDPNLMPIMTQADRDALRAGGQFTDDEIAHAHQQAAYRGITGGVVETTNPLASELSRESEDETESEKSDEDKSKEKAGNDDDDVKLL